MHPQVVVLGGGHGLAASIRAVRRYAARTTAVVATADDGGSTGRLRSALALPAPGDLRRCLVAMAEPVGPGDRHGALAAAFEHRFEGTDVEGHALGNLVLAGLTAVTGDFVAAVDEASAMLGLDPAVARVLPATAEPVELRGRTEGGHEIAGQVAVSRSCGIHRIALDPPDARAPAAVVEALADADQIVLGPGSLFTSVLAAAVVGGIAPAIGASGAQRVYVCNLRAEPGESTGFDVGAHLQALRRHGVAVDVVVTQRHGLPLGRLAGTEVVEADVARPNGLAHDSEKLAAVLAAIAPG